MDDAMGLWVASLALRAPVAMAWAAGEKARA